MNQHSTDTCWIHWNQNKDSTLLKLFIHAGKCRLHRFSPSINNATGCFVSVRLSFYSLSDVMGKRQRLRPSLSFKAYSYRWGLIILKIFGFCQSKRPRAVTTMTAPRSAARADVKTEQMETKTPPCWMSGASCSPSGDSDCKSSTWSTGAPCPLKRC